MNRALLNAILCTVVETGDAGAPEGVMYAALCGSMTLDEFQAATAFMADQGLVRREGNLLYPTERLIQAYGSAKAKAQATGGAR